MSGRLTALLAAAALAAAGSPVAPCGAADAPTVPRPRNKPSLDELVKRFDAHTYRSPAGGTLGYRLFKPPGLDPAAKKTYPLVLFLHGAGERGSDNRIQLKHFVWRLVEDATQRKHPCFVLVPQCPRTQWRFVLAGRSRGGLPARPGYDTARGGWQTFRLPVGRAFRGPRRCLTFLTVPGRSGKPAVGEYRNVKVYEDGAPGAKPVRFARGRLHGFGSPRPPEGAAVADDGLRLTLTAPPGGPTVGVWVELPYQATEKTILELQFRTDAPGAAHLVGLDASPDLALAWWSAIDFATGRLQPQPAMPMRLTLELVEALRKRLPIDPDRLYVGGLSMGGFGTWDAILRHPELFAAAFPICGGGDPTKADRIAHLPIWVFHGAADRVVPPQLSRRMVAALKKAGAEHVRYTEYPGVGHGSWEPASAEPEFIDWLFAQVRRGRDKKK